MEDQRKISVNRVEWVLFGRKPFMCAKPKKMYFAKFYF